MSPVTTTRFPPTTTPSREYVPGIAVAVVTTAVLVLGVLPAMGTAPHVDVVRFENPNPAEVGVEVTSGRRDGWVGIGPIEEEDVEAVEEVYDPGNTWIFRFTNPGQPPEEITISRDDLEAADWTIEIPDLSG
jgi:hypothetical protein